MVSPPFTTAVLLPGRYREQCPALEKVVDEAIPRVEVNLERFAHSTRAKSNLKSTFDNGYLKPKNNLMKYHQVA
jgi:hypothetical protein